MARSHAIVHAAGHPRHPSNVRALLHARHRAACKYQQFSLCRATKCQVAYECEEERAWDEGQLRVSLIRSSRAGGSRMKGTRYCTLERDGDDLSGMKRTERKTPLVLLLIYLNWALSLIVGTIVRTFPFSAKKWKKMPLYQINIRAFYLYSFKRSVYICSIRWYLYKNKTVSYCFFKNARECLK